MINVLISGANGRMGKKVYEAVCGAENITATCGVDVVNDFSKPNYPIYSSFDKIKEKVDVIVDFSAPSYIIVTAYTFLPFMFFGCKIQSTFYSLAFLH